jgi:GntR family transcriptional regulator
MASLAHIRIDPATPTPIYRQIVDQLRVLIVEGTLEAAQPLPPVRQLALELGVHFNTVAEVYRLLAQEGLVETSHGRTARIAAPNHSTLGHKQQQEALDMLRQRVRQLVAELCTRGLSRQQISHELRCFSKELEA